MVRIDLDLARVAGLQLVFALFLVPDRIALTGDSWGFLQPGAPGAFTRGFSFLSRSGDARVRSAFDALAGELGRRDARFSDASAGARLRWSASGDREPAPGPYLRGQPVR
jgi:hypothetical protein